MFSPSTLEEAKRLHVLVGCERSGVVREAFRALGQDAYSCDLTPAEDDSPFHLQMDVREALKRAPWDLFIVHPDCTRLANSGVLRLYVGGKQKNGRDIHKWEAMEIAAQFFKEMLDADVPRICVENPVMHRWAKQIIGVNQTQTIQPWQFGDDASKRTCLWLKGLPPLQPTNILRKARYANQTPSGQNKLGPSPTRHIERARTYPGPAKAMAQQWTEWVLKNPGHGTDKIFCKQHARMQEVRDEQLQGNLSRQR